ncbi:hypothetical protein HNQ51_002517 [Inhella inkyongensis]|uniref:YdhG-like domain-containing protein n=1 Tax=Inhella inkyongensis TaxID=392593 RepID=A0A840S6R1_9BURK|nr:DUF1801 domain-containing protein [Inhella inkyongensis]MBB5205198.1 hypothetical protein [Inhella inkyongensis]
MQSQAVSVDQYLIELPPERQAPMRQLRELLRARLPAGFEECMAYGMPAYVVPHRLYPAGYHCNPKLPLPFISLASQKQAITLYHMGLYSDGELLAWFQTEHARVSSRKLDMGKCCVRYKKAEHIPFELIGDLVSRWTPQDWIQRYEAQIQR